MRELLRTAGLPYDGLPGDLAEFFVAVEGPALVGAIGLERYGRAGLLRSAVVHADRRGTGLGELLVRTLLDHAREVGVRELVLLTTTAERWFPRFGFVPIARSAAPAALNASTEFQDACPDTAIAMQLLLM